MVKKIFLILFILLLLFPLSGFFPEAISGNTNDTLDFQSADESSFSQEDLAYSTTLTPSATTGVITLTLGSGNWNDNSKVKAGNRVIGNGGIATIVETPQASSTIKAYVDDDFNNTNAITSGEWHLYGTKFSSLEQLVLNDFLVKKAFNDTGYGSVGPTAVAKIDTNKVLIAYGDSTTGYGGEAVVASVSGTTITYGDEATFNAAYTAYISAAQLTTDKAIIAYRDWGQDYYGNAIVASVSGTTISFGSEATFNAASTEYISVAQLTTDKALIAYQDWDDGYGNAIVASVSGTTISFGSEATFNTTSHYSVSVAQLDTDKAIIAYRDWGQDYYGNAIVASVSGTTISFGSEATFNAASTEYVSVAQLTTNKAIIAYREEQSSYGNAIVASVSGTTISYGSEATFNAAATHYVSAAQLGTDKAIIAYRGGQLDYGNAIVASVSDTTISYGSEATFNAATLFAISAAQLGTDKAIIAYRDEGQSSYGNAIVASVSETTITYGSEATFNQSASVSSVSVAKLDTNKVLIAYQDTAQSDYGKAIVASVSGTSITYGAEATFNAAYTWEYISVAQLGTDKAIIAYLDADTEEGQAIVASVSGTTITYGDEATFNAAWTEYISTTQLGTDKALIAYLDYDVDEGQAIVASVSGTTISFGTEATFNTAYTSYISAAQLTTDKAIIAYWDDDAEEGQAIVASVSGTTISFGTEATFNAAYTWPISAAQLTTDKAIIAYWDDDAGEGQAIVASVSGTTISFGNEATFNAAYAEYISVAQLGTDKAIIAYQDEGQSSYGNAIVASVSETTITYGDEATFNAAYTEYISAAQLDTDKAFIGFNSYGETQGYGLGIVYIDGIDFSFTGYPANDYYITTTSDSNQLLVSSWGDINSGTVSETLNSQTINYGISFDDRTTWKIYDTTGGDSGWRPIARDNSGTWEYNSNTTAGATDITWTAASTNTQFGALDQAFQIAANQMTGTEFNAITNSQWEETGGFVSGTTNYLDFAFGLKSTSETATPVVDGISISYDDVSTPTPTPTSTNNNSSLPSAPVCTDRLPGIPQLFQIDTTKTTAKLYFVPAHDPVNKYFIAYGLTKDNLEYGVEYNQGYSSGVLCYTINFLSPNTNYYFKVRAGNGCMPGGWSNLMRGKTTTSKSTKKSFYPKDLNEPLSIEQSSLIKISQSNIEGALIISPTPTFVPHITLKPSPSPIPTLNISLPAAQHPQPSTKPDPFYLKLAKWILSIFKK
jgi:hypothetical protein